MDKRPFYFKLIPPRPTFPYDMTKEEKELWTSTARTSKRSLMRASFFFMVR